MSEASLITGTSTAIGGAVVRQGVAAAAVVGSAGFHRYQQRRSMCSTSTVKKKAAATAPAPGGLPPCCSKKHLLEVVKAGTSVGKAAASRGPVCDCCRSAIDTKSLSAHQHGGTTSTAAALYYCPECDYDVCPTCYANQKSKQSSPSTMDNTSSKEDPHAAAAQAAQVMDVAQELAAKGVCCSKNHAVQRVVPGSAMGTAATKRGPVCDICRQGISAPSGSSSSADTLLYCCATCDYDLCPACHCKSAAALQDAAAKATTEFSVTTEAARAATSAAAAAATEKAEQEARSKTLAAYAEVASQEAEKEKALKKPQNGEGGGWCPSKHPLARVPFGSDAGMDAAFRRPKCNDCNKEIPTHVATADGDDETLLFRCAACDYDQCVSCNKSKKVCCTKSHLVEPVLPGTFMAEAAVHRVATCDKCRTLISHSATTKPTSTSSSAVFYHCPKAGCDYDLCIKCHSAAVDAPSSMTKEAVPPEAPLTAAAPTPTSAEKKKLATCLKGHSVKPSTSNLDASTRGAVCDRCRKGIEPAAPNATTPTLFSCAECDYDLCPGCHAAGGGILQGADLSPLEELNCKLADMRRRAFNLELDAENQRQSVATMTHKVLLAKKMATPENAPVVLTAMSPECMRLDDTLLTLTREIQSLEIKRPAPLSSSAAVAGTTNPTMRIVPTNEAHGHRLVQQVQGALSKWSALVSKFQAQSDAHVKTIYKLCMQEEMIRENPQDFVEQQSTTTTAASSTTATSSAASSNNASTSATAATAEPKPTSQGTPPRWYTIDPRTGQQVDYPMAHHANLESAYARAAQGQKSSVDVKIVVGSKTETFTVFFDTMTQVSAKGYPRGRRSVFREEVLADGTTSTEPCMPPQKPAPEAPPASADVLWYSRDFRTNKDVVYSKEDCQKLEAAYQHGNQVLESIYATAGAKITAPKSDFYAPVPVEINGHSFVVDVYKMKQYNKKNASRTVFRVEPVSPREFVEMGTEAQPSMEKQPLDDDVAEKPVKLDEGENLPDKQQTEKKVSPDVFNLDAATKTAEPDKVIRQAVADIAKMVEGLDAQKKESAEMKKTMEKILQAVNLNVNQSERTLKEQRTAFELLQDEYQQRAKEQQAETENDKKRAEAGAKSESEGDQGATSSNASASWFYDFCAFVVGVLAVRLAFFVLGISVAEKMGWTKDNQEWIHRKREGCFPGTLQLEPAKGWASDFKQYKAPTTKDEEGAALKTRDPKDDDITTSTSTTTLSPHSFVVAPRDTIPVVRPVADGKPEGPLRVVITTPIATPKVDEAPQPAVDEAPQPAVDEVPSLTQLEQAQADAEAKRVGQFLSWARVGGVLLLGLGALELY